MGRRGAAAKPWYRRGRGWYVTEKGHGTKPLRDPDTGAHLKDKDTPKDHLEYAHAAYLVAAKTTQPSVIDPVSGATVRDVCIEYLNYCMQANSTSTYKGRRSVLNDFSKRYGSELAATITEKHLNRWVRSHATWKQPRYPMAAVVRAFSHAVDAELLDENPLCGLRLPEAGVATSYITREQEAVLVAEANRSLGMAIEACIATGARPGCEFGAVCPRHVRIDEATGRMAWVFPAKEAKDRKKERVIRIPPEIAEMTQRELDGRSRNEPIFRNTRGRPWSDESLSCAFLATKRRLEGDGHDFPDHCTIYSCRHTFAKRQLEKGLSIPQIAKQLGNSVRICERHYAQWDAKQEDVLWEGLD